MMTSDLGNNAIVQSEVVSSRVPMLWILIRRVMCISVIRAVEATQVFPQIKYTTSLKPSSWPSKHCSSNCPSPLSQVVISSISLQALPSSEVGSAGAGFDPRGFGGSQWVWRGENVAADPIRWEKARGFTCSVFGLFRQSGPGHDRVLAVDIPSESPV